MSTQLTAQQVVEQLTQPPVSPAEAKRPAAQGGLPDEPGFYSWWLPADALAGVPPCPHPTEPLHLLYVGISPRNANSKQRLRGRVGSNHLGGNTGGSTFRYSLAALLLEELDLHPEVRGPKYLLPPEENRRLLEWQRATLRVVWCVRERPWEVEGQVIGLMQPPLNLSSNREHPFWPVMEAARRRFRAAATPGRGSANAT